MNSTTTISNDNLNPKSSKTLSVVIPLFNSEDWIAETIRHILQELTTIPQQVEIVIVNDGSTDLSLENIKFFQSRAEVQIITTDNHGRFSARATGVEQAKNDYIVFVDSRVTIHPGSLKFMIDKVQNGGIHQLWNARVSLPSGLSAVSYFWEGIEFLAWRKHHRGPQEISVHRDQLDFHPVGTTMFGAPRQWLLDSNEIIRRDHVDLHKISDDTRLIRQLVEQADLNYSPMFSCTYQPRTMSAGFAKHAYHRGTVFVDGHLRRGGRYVGPFILLVLFQISSLVLFFFQPMLMAILLSLSMTAMAISLQYLKMPRRAQKALFLYGALFVPAYFAGVVTGLILKIKTRLSITKKAVSSEFSN